MLFSAVHLRDVSRWARGNGLEILLIAIGAALITRFVHWTSALYRRRIEDEIRREIERGGVASEQHKRARTVSQVIEWGIIVLVYFLAPQDYIQTSGEFRCTNNKQNSNSS